MKPICRNISTNDLYEFNGENNFTNLRTMQSGNINDDKAKEVLKINLEATEMINEYPIIKELINKLNLKMEK